MPRTSGSAQVNLDLPFDLRDQLKARAEAEAIPFKALIVRALENELAKKIKKPKKADLETGVAPLAPKRGRPKKLKP